jgi:simple sugar transport system ATP-binding protein
VLLAADGITVAGAGEKNVVEDVSFHVRAGEVVGIAGVEGNGQFELCEALLGLTPLAAGSITFDGADITSTSTRQRRDGGIGYVPFDRHKEGLMLQAPLWENVLLGREDETQFLRGPLINIGASKEAARDVIERFGVRTPNETVPAFALSGGNQQKLVVGREFSSSPKVLIAAHPTRGVDIGAQAAIWDELRAARDNGLGVLLISADLEELIGLSDRILVMFDGAVNAELDPASATPELLGTYMTGGTPEEGQ